MAHYSRRDFLKTGLAAGALAGSRKPAAYERRARQLRIG